MTIIGLAIVGVGLWALMFYSTAPSNLEPYENYQESQKNSKAKSDNQKSTANIDSCLLYTSPSPRD